MRVALFKKFVIAIIAILMIVPPLAPEARAANDQDKNAFADALSGAITTGVKYKWLKIKESRARAKNVKSVPTKNAEDAVHDRADSRKEYLWDGVAWAFANSLIESMSASVVNWINSGFEGRPAFIQNLKEQDAEVSNKVFEQFVYEMEASDIMCRSFRDQILEKLSEELAVLQSRGGGRGREELYRAGNSCTLDEFFNNFGSSYEEFERDFSGGGGWAAWMYATQMGNTQMGREILTAEELQRRQAEALKNQERELDYGGGFLSFKQKGKCLDQHNFNNNFFANTGSPSPLLSPQDQGFNDDFLTNTGPPSPLLSPQESECKNWRPPRIMTPGGVIQEQLNKSLGLGQQKLLLADEIDEVLSALISQLVKNVLTDAKGLWGASQTSNNNQSYTSQILSGGNDLQTSKEKVLSQFALAIESVDLFIENKREEISRIESSIDLLNELIICYEKGNELSGNSNLNSEKILDAENSILELQGKIADRQDEIGEAEEIGTVILEFAQELDTAPSFLEVNSIMQEYVSSGIDQYVDQMAQFSEDDLQSLQDDIDDYDLETNNSINTCEEDNLSYSNTS